MIELENKWIIWQQSVYEYVNEWMNDITMCEYNDIQYEYEIYNIDMMYSMNMNMNKWMMYNDEYVWI